MDNTRSHVRMRFEKKAQLTLFIILGLVLVLIVAAGIFFLVRRPPVILAPPEVLTPFVKHTEDCLRRTTLDGLRLIGAQGGWMVIPKENTVLTEQGTAALGYDRGVSRLPDRARAAEELGAFISAAIANCLKLELFPAVQVEKRKEPAARVSIGDENVQVRFTWDVILRSGDVASSLPELAYNAPVRLGLALNVAQEIVQSFVTEPGNVPITRFSQYPLKVQLLPVSAEGERVLVVTLSDLRVHIEQEPYLFLFANRFVINQPPRITNLPERLELKQGQRFQLALAASDPEGDAVTFRDDTPLFDMSSQGQIDFTPRTAGEYEVTITATDAQQNEAAQRVVLVVAP